MFAASSFPHVFTRPMFTTSLPGNPSDGGTGTFTIASVTLRPKCV